MAEALLRENGEPELSQARIPDDLFDRLRAENLARWPTGADALDMDETVAYLQGVPEHKRLGPVMRKAVAESRCLTQPRGGFGTFELQKQLMTCLDEDGLADIVPTTTDSYTRNERFALAKEGIRESEEMGRSMINGFPIVNYGVDACRRLNEAISKPTIVLSGTAMPKLTSEIGIAGGYTGYLGSAIAYTVSYTKDVSIETGIRNYQYLDRLAALYSEKGVDIHRRQPGFLTGTVIPPSIAIMTCVLDVLLAAEQGVRNYGLEMGQTLHLIQDAAAVSACRELCQEYLKKRGFDDVFTPITLLHWMGAWPHDEAQCAALVSYGGTLAAISGAASVTTKATHEAFGIPTPEANAEGLRMTRMAVYLARNIRLDGHPEFEREREHILNEARPVLDKTLEMGDGDVAVGAVRAFEAGVLDIPWSPSRYVKSRVTPARDVDGYIRILDPGDMPLSKDVIAFNEDRLRARAERDGIPFGLDLAVESVYEISEPLSNLIPFPWKPSD